MVSLYSKIPIDLLESKEPNLMLFKNPHNVDNISATYKLNESLERIEIGIRTVEGQ